MEKEEEKLTKEEVEEELKKIDEDLEDLVLDEDLETEIEDILSEEMLQQSSSRLNSFLMGQDNSPSLEQREFTPIVNLEEGLPEVEEKKEHEEEKRIEYLIEDEENKQIYQSETDNLPVATGQTGIMSDQQKFESEQKELYSQMKGTSSELAFVQKAQRPEYVKAKELKEEDFGKEHKRTVENALKKMKEDYK